MLFSRERLLVSVKSCEEFLAFNPQPLSKTIKRLLSRLRLHGEITLSKTIPQQPRFEYDWFGDNSKTWPKYLGHFAGLRNLQCLEIGCFEGRSALWTLENIATHPTSRLWIVDQFSRHSVTESATPFSPTQHLIQNLCSVGQSHRVIFVQGASQIELRKLPISFFYFIYIDGSHRAPDVLSDIVLGWELLRIDGILILDDYEWMPELAERERPKLAIDSFLKVFEGQFEILHQGYQVILRKIV